ncbi:hypothetical protein MSG28_016194 [Choristoneura fumiferana]|uniref:Uncharacterized protein n=1 Tax=Choristoneura fumiferana TaxID=7141 RepID=A0ACC0K5S9_CHOFU|nr:hypothetical protein MSG28_016194 [Choristoneura fumiferana]
MKREEEEILGEQRRIEKQKKRPTPRVGKPKPVFGPLTPAERPLVLPGGRKWRKPKDAYNEQFIAETLAAQAELIQGKAMGKTYESVHLPYDERESNCHLVDFHLLRANLVLPFESIADNSDVYKLIHNMESAPARRVDMLTPVVAEADYREVRNAGL